MNGNRKSPSKWPWFALPLIAPGLGFAIGVACGVVFVVAHFFVGRSTIGEAVEGLALIGGEFGMVGGSIGLLMAPVLAIVGWMRRAK